LYLRMSRDGLVFVEKIIQANQCFSENELKNRRGCLFSQHFLLWKRYTWKHKSRIVFARFLSDHIASP